MEVWIISTAQQARPNVMNISEPERAQVIRASDEVTRNPLSESSSLIAPKKGSLCPTGLPVDGSRMPVGLGATRVPEAAPAVAVGLNPIPALPSSIHR